MADETNEIDWAVREESLLALKKDDLVAMATQAELDPSGNKADIVARIIVKEQDSLAPVDGVPVEPTDDGDINVDPEAITDVTPDADDADDESDEADADAEDSADEESQEGIGDAAAPADLAVGDAMADVSAELAADEAEAIKAAADHERAHSMAVPATPGTVVTLDPTRLVKPTKPAEAWDALKGSIQADLEAQFDGVFQDAAEAAAFAAEFAEKLAKYKYKAATARDTFQKRQYTQNLKHLEAQAATEAARVKMKLVKNGDDLLMRILTMTVKAVAGAALGALL